MTTGLAPGYGHRAERALMTDVDDVMTDMDNRVADLSRSSSASHWARTCQAGCRGPPSGVHG